ncbi:putative hydrolase or acyltransferase of alpha/beta superfamily [Prauserella sp. Am3]|nr:putative hydrolase or acyltransferase of alpha/beta superfamily [Prauserella sp. Am3]
MGMLTASDGVELYVTEAGSGPPLVIVPGWGVSHRWFREQFTDEMTSRFRVICYDPRGQGESEKTERGQRMGRMAADLADVIASVGEPQVHVLAWSGGGSTVMQYVELFGTRALRSATLVGAGPRLMKAPDWEHGFLGLEDAKNWVDLIRGDLDTAVRGLAPQFFAGDPGRDVLEWAIADMARCHPAGASRASWDFLNADYRDVLADITVPTLVVSGDQDVSVPAGNAPYLHEHIPGSRLTVIDDAAHCPFLEQPRAFNAAVTGFLDEAA